MKKNLFLLICYLSMFSESVMASEKEPEQYYEKAKAAYQKDDCQLTMKYLDLYATHGNPSLERKESIRKVREWCKSSLVVETNSQEESPSAVSTLAMPVRVVQTVKGMVKNPNEVSSTDTELTIPWRNKAYGIEESDEGGRFKLPKIYFLTNRAQTDNLGKLKLQMQDSPLKSYHSEIRIELLKSLSDHKFDVDYNNPNRRLILDYTKIEELKTFDKPKF